MSRSPGGPVLLAALDSNNSQLRVEEQSPGFSQWTVFQMQSAEPTSGQTIAEAGTGAASEYIAPAGDYEAAKTLLLFAKANTNTVDTLAVYVETSWDEVKWFRLTDNVGAAAAVLTLTALNTTGVYRGISFTISAPFIRLWYDVTDASGDSAVVSAYLMMRP